MAAAHLAAAVDRPLVLGHVAAPRLTVHPAPVGAGVLQVATPRSTGGDVDAARLRGLRLLHTVACELPVDAGVAVRTGDPTRELGALVREHDPAAVVLGIEDRGSATRPRWRSVARPGRCPTLLVPPDGILGPGPVLAVHDGTARGARGVLHAAGAAVALGRALVVTRNLRGAEPAPPDAAAVRELRALAADAMRLTEAEVRCVVTHGTPAAELRALADDLAAAFVVVGPPRRFVPGPAPSRRGGPPVLVTPGRRPG